MIHRILVLTLVLAPLVAACGDDDDATTTADDTSSDEAAQDETTTTAAATDGGLYGGGGETGDGDEPASDAAAVEIEGFAYQPASIEVPAGTAVTWTNADGVGHTVTAGEPDAPADTFGESVDGGSSAEITFDESGTFPYFCTIHPSMTGEVVVT